MLDHIKRVWPVLIMHLVTVSALAGPQLTSAAPGIIRVGQEVEMQLIFDEPIGGFDPTTGGAVEWIGSPKIDGNRVLCLVRGVEPGDGYVRLEDEHGVRSQTVCIVFREVSDLCITLSHSVLTLASSETETLAESLALDASAKSLVQAGIEFVRPGRHEQALRFVRTAVAHYVLRPSRADCSSRIGNVSACGHSEHRADLL